MLLVSYIQQYFNTSITVLTNQVWKLLIALFKVQNTGVFTVLQLQFAFTSTKQTSTVTEQRLNHLQTPNFKFMTLHTCRKLLSVLSLIDQAITRPHLTSHSRHHVRYQGDRKFKLTFCPLQQPAWPIYTCRPTYKYKPWICQPILSLGFKTHSKWRSQNIYSQAGKKLYFIIKLATQIISLFSLQISKT